MVPEQRAAELRLQWRPYRFALPREMVTSQGAWSLRQGWLLRLASSDGRLGWGEAALPPGAAAGDAAAAALPERMRRADLEQRLPALPPPLACAVGMALAEIDGLGAAEHGGWLPPPPSALLLPAGETAITDLEQALASQRASGPAPTTPEGPSGGDVGSHRLTIKWKVAAGDDDRERQLLEALLERLPAGSRLRLDANGGWDRDTADRWAAQLAGEERLDWLEQPLPPADHTGLEQLAGRVPVALDESLRQQPALLQQDWQGWQVRRPLAEGDPRPLLAALQTGRPRLMLSTALETGIGRRLLHHLAALQALGPTPTAPGLAPGWRPQGALFSSDPEVVWEALA